MKTHNLNLKALILILVLTLTGQLYAHKYSHIADEKKAVKINMKAPLVKFIINTMEINSENIENFKQHLQEANFVLINNSLDLEFTMIDSEHSDSFLVIEYNNVDYLDTEAAPVIEDWMSDEYYLNAEAAPVIEDWMSDEYYLNTEATPVIEDWMSDVDYLNTEAQPEIEDWMLDVDYLNTEATPVIEDWMMNQLNCE